jgi:hypothetical protein
MWPECSRRSSWQLTRHISPQSLYKNKTFRINNSVDYSQDFESRMQFGGSVPP